MKKLLHCFILFFFIIEAINAQGNFNFLDAVTKKQDVNFKLINNLIVIPVTINGAKLSFILDSGVSKTILFNLQKNDSLSLNNVRKVFIRGLGKGEPVAALLSKNNTFKLKNLVNTNESLYVILKDAFDISAKMGVTIHGIIGYDLLKDVVARVNYNTKKIRFYNPKFYKKKRCRKCAVFPLEFYKNKPYINTLVQLDTIGSKQRILKLLIDTGGSDAIWLFNDAKKNINTPIKSFTDILGEGFSGTIYGYRSKIPAVYLENYKIKKPTVSFLDTTSTLNARKFKERNGSIGGALLKRFKVWIDYPNKELVLKKNASLKKGFYYNMSGLQVVYNGKELVKEEAIDRFVNSYGSENKSSNKVISFITNYNYKFKPSYKIDVVLENSPAAKAGLLAGDIIKSINGKPAYNYTLGDIVSLFQSKPNRKIRIKVLRGVTVFEYEFTLKERI